MADVIRHKRSATASAVPSAGQLELGELAINVADGRLYFKKSSGDIVAVANLADVWALQPIGVPFAIWSHLAGVDIPPNDNPNYRYIKLTASDSYNDGVLISESISGSAPLVQATAVINDAASPMNGQMVRLMNTERRFLRAGQSGVVEADAMEAHTHSYSQPTTNGFGPPDNSYSRPNGINSGASTGGASGRTANETRPKNLGADYYTRIR